MRRVIIALVISICYCAAQTFDPSQSYVVGGGVNEAWTNNPSAFTIILVDTTGQPLTTSPSPLPPLECYATDGVETYPCGMEDNLDGTISAWYVATHIGEHQLFVYSGETPLTESTQSYETPWTFQVYGPDAAESYANGQGVINGPSGVPKVVFIHGKDVNGASIPFGSDPFMTVVFRPNDEEFTGGSFSDNYDGTYTYAFTPDHNGAWRVHCTLDGVHIGGSPYTPTFSGN